LEKNLTVYDRLRQANLHFANPFGYLSGEPKLERRKTMASKSDVARALAAKEDLSQKDAAQITNSFFEVLTGMIQAGELSIQDFGTFKLAVRKARIGRNPKTGESVDIPERTVARFKPSKNLLKS
jgi:nucleoid DNA-binding protein